MKCFKCGFTEHRKDALYCKNCGFLLNSNYCTNEHCMAYNNSDEPIPLTEDSCFCDYCGSESEFFKQGFIKPNPRID